MRFSDYFKLGGSNFLRNGFKTIAPIVIITMGIIVFNIVAGFFTSITESMNTTVVENNSLKFIEVVATPENELKMKDFKKISGINGVVTSIPKVEAFVGLESGDIRETTDLVGVNNKSVSFFTSGNNQYIPDDSIILNSSVAKELKVGENIKVSYTVKIKEGEGIRKTKSGKISSRYDQFYLASYQDGFSLASIDYVEQINASFLGLSLEDYRRNLNYDTGTVIVKDVEQITNVAKKIEALGYDTSYALKSSESIPTVAKMIIAVGGIIIILLLILSGISIASIIGQSLRGRYKEIGIMRAVGYQRSHLIKLFSIEVLYISLISFVLSTIFSFILIKGIEFFLNRSNEIDYIFNISMNGTQILISFGLIVLVSFFASFRPILKASSINITDIIRGNAS